MLQQPEPLFAENSVRTRELVNQPALKICCLRVADACDMGPHTLYSSRGPRKRGNLWEIIQSDPSGPKEEPQPQAPCFPISINVVHCSVLSSPWLVLSMAVVPLGPMLGLHPSILGPALLLSKNWEWCLLPCCQHHLATLSFSYFQGLTSLNRGRFSRPLHLPKGAPVGSLQEEPAENQEIMTPNMHEMPHVRIQGSRLQTWDGRR